MEKAINDLFEEIKPLKALAIKEMLTNDDLTSEDIDGYIYVLRAIDNLKVVMTAEANTLTELNNKMDRLFTIAMSKKEES
ncbi:MAG: hypothetical protein LIO96_08025 [Lachnospiraceae bacterium]|nr:hypothetical protein [Lachnospiraceae bacterium]